MNIFRYGFPIIETLLLWRSAMRAIFKYLKPYKTYMIAAWALMLVELVVELLLPIFLVKMIDEGIMKHDFSLVLQWGFIMLLASFISFVSGIVNSFAAAHVGQHFGFDLRNRLFEKLQTLGLEQLLSFHPSSLITRLTNDVTQLQNTVFMSLRIMLRAPLLVVFGMIMALVVHIKLALIYVIFVPILFAFLVWMMNKGALLFKVVQGKLDLINHVIRENLTAMKLIKAYVRGKYEERRFREANEEYKNRTIFTMRTVEITMPILLFLMNMSILLILWYGNIEIQHDGATPGEIVAIVNYGMRITAALSIFTFIIVVFSRAKASAERVSDLLEAEGDQSVITSKSQDNIILNGKITFNDVSFYYPTTNKPIIRQISFSVRPGEKVAVLGETGSGKTSLLQLIPRLFDASIGQVCIDDTDVRSIDKRLLRSQIGFVPQDTLLFSGTIKENILWGKKDASMDEAIKAAQAAQIHETIMDMPNQYETVIGQKGSNLSGGQRQRIAIARALIRNPKILLLDDCTSALDVQTEARLLKELETYNCTTIMVTQKISTAMKADTILLLQEGQLIGRGTHEELLHINPLYQTLYDSQVRKGRKAHGSTFYSTSPNS